MKWIKENSNVIKTDDGRYSVNRFRHDHVDEEFFVAVFTAGNRETGILAYSYNAKDCFWACRKHNLRQWEHKTPQEWRVESFWERLRKAYKKHGLRELREIPGLPAGIPCPRDPAEAIY